MRRVFELGVDWEPEARSRGLGVRLGVYMQGLTFCIHNVSAYQILCVVTEEDAVPKP